ncbi:MAG TPA: 16S rRNA (guanine(527)-N(7))-methyltransferase RsmG [Solirubrobacteraceae bacterium]|nr:16S rRNA (guanine(527)-N(7))-methyltransferase RsmG [Solirubrobacteraceae bacterium]
MKHRPALADLARRYRLGADQQGQLVAMLRAIEEDHRAPTSARERERALEVHVADALVATELAEMRAARRLVDIGSGAGVPGAVLAVALPDCRVSLLESQGRKCAFLEDLVGAAAITNAEVVCARAEEWTAGRELHDVASARALAAQPVVLEYAAPLLRVGGVLVDWRGRRDPEEEQAAVRAGELLGMERRAIVAVAPYPQARDLHLHLWAKREATPQRFPRRAGIARKRPLGAKRR